MRGKRSSVVVPFEAGKPGGRTKGPNASSLAASELTTLELLVEVEAEMVRLRTQNRRLTSALKAATSKVASLEKKGRKAGARKPRGKPTAEIESADPPATGEAVAVKEEKPAPRRSALGRGLAQILSIKGSIRRQLQ